MSKIRVEINGKMRNLKSLNFSFLREQLINGIKFRTFRTNYITRYRVGEVIAVKYQKNELLFVVPVKAYYPKMLKNVSEEEAIEDGFENKQQFINAILEINNIRDHEQWGFFTVWDPSKRVFPNELNGTSLEAWL